MNTRAYLVAFLRPDAYRLGIFSEPSPTARGDVYTVEVLSAQGVDFSDAVRNLRKQIRLYVPEPIAKLVIDDTGVK